MELSIRVTSETATHEDIMKILDPVTDRYIIGLEHANSRHFQCYARYVKPDDLKYSKLRYIFKKEGYAGNSKLSLTKMKKDSLMVYVTKDGDIRYKGFTPEEIADLSARSYDRPVSYKARKTELNKLFLSGEKSLQSYITARIDLTIEFEMGFNERRLREEIDTLRMAKDVRVKREKISDILFSYGEVYETNAYLSQVRKKEILQKEEEHSDVEPEAYDP